MRSYCQRCNYPDKTCLCDQVKEFTVPQRIVILQHPEEVSNAKNTLRLIKLCLPQTEVVIGESVKDFAAISESLKKSKVACIYPGENSKALEDTDDTDTDIDTILLIDASWRKAFKILQLNNWIKDIPQYHFSHPPEGKYHIRKAPKEGYLSTLEALSYTLNCLGNDDTAPLTRLFNHFNQQVLSYRK